MASVYERIGESGFERLVAGFYRRVRNDDLLGPMYPPDDWDAAEERLRDFLVGRFGGPMRYVERRGHPRLRMRHMPFRIDSAARDRWLDLMGAAMAEAKLPDDVAAVLTPYFVQTADHMRNAPDGEPGPADLLNRRLPPDG